MHEQPRPDDEIELLDLLVTVAENIKLLILGPMLAGAMAFVAVSLWPVASVYQASFEINGDKKKGSLMTADEVIKLFTEKEVLAGAVNSLQASGQGPWDQLRLPGAVLAEILPKTSQVRVLVQAQDPKDVQAMAQALLAAGVAKSRPTDQKLQILQLAVKQDQVFLGNYQIMLSSIGEKINKPDQIDGVLPQAYLNLIKAADRLSKKIEANQQIMNGLSEKDILARPDLPKIVENSKSSMLPILVFLFTGFVLLLGVFVRKAFQGALLNPESAAKINRIRQALGLKARA
jgi:hypothetical protein